MLYERHFESKTLGIIQGATILNSDIPTPVGVLYGAKKSNFINKQELFFGEKLLDARNSVEKNPANGINSWKIVIRSRETKEPIWMRPFLNKSEAAITWFRLIGADLERIHQSAFASFPSYWQEGDLEYLFATVTTYTSIGTTTWTAPTGITQTDYLVVAGGGGGGGFTGGGGGAGGYRTATGFSVTAGNLYTVTVGGGGVGGTGSSNGNKGSDSVFSTITSTGGGYGGYQSAGAGGSGGGGGWGSSSLGGAGNTPSTTPSQGNSGGNGCSGATYQCGGGGGASQAGATATVTQPGKGGDGSSSSISGSSVTYAGGGGGGADWFRSVTAQGAGGAGGGGTGASNVAGTTGTANTGGGGGGGANSGSYQAGYAGGSGIVILSYGATSANFLRFNSPMLGM